MKQFNFKVLNRNALPEKIKGILMKSLYAAVLACAAIFLGAAHVSALELKDCPAPVIKTVNEQLEAGERVTSIKSVTEGDWTYFEVTTNKEGYMTVDPDGTLESIDLGTDIDDLPVVVKKAIKKLPGKLEDVYMELNDEGVAEYTVEKLVKGSLVITRISSDGSLLK